jgi:hypothetical protein
MERRLPPEYAGWQEFEARFRQSSTPDLVQEIQDGAPQRRLAALSVINLSEVTDQTIRDWIQTLPEPEANELAGAIPAQRAHATCEEERRWVKVASLGYEIRRLPTFLVMLFSSLETLERRRCSGNSEDWDTVGKWLVGVYGTLAAEADEQALEDISLFIFENYLDREPILDAFCQLVEAHLPLAHAVSGNPSFLLGPLSVEQQRRVLRAAEEGGGLPFEASWGALNERWF